MLVYLDANIVQYCVDYYAPGLRWTTYPPDRGLETELQALGEIIELVAYAEAQDLDHRWDVVAPEHLLVELERGHPTNEQLAAYRDLRESWNHLGEEKHGSPDAEAVDRAQKRLARLKLKHAPDTLHVAEAVAIQAAWFLTCDKDILKKTRNKAKPKDPAMIEGVTVGRPTELRARMRFDPIFGLRLEQSSHRQSSHALAALTEELPLFRGYLNRGTS